MHISNINKIRLLSAALFCAVYWITTCAFAPKEIVTSDIISAQSVTGEEASAPYNVTGESLVAMIQSVVGFDTPGSSIVFNRRTGQVFVRNTPLNHEVITRILDTIRQAVKRQVSIEARIITVSDTDFEGLGIDSGSWNFGTTSPTEKYFSAGSGTVNGHAYTTNATTSNFPDLNTVLTSTATGAAFPLQFTRPKSFDLNATIDALARVSSLNTLAAPHITVFNTQRANISIEKHEYYVAKLDSTFEGSGADRTVAQDPDVGVARSGTILDVTPTINANDTITLELHPHYVRVDLTNTQEIQNGSGADTPNQVTLPTYNSQEINTTVTVENGGVVILGGLISEEEISQHDKVPGLGNIPLIGKLFFQSNQDKNVKTHLLIFVKATIKDI